MDRCVDGWVAGFCEIIPSSATAKGRVAARAELGHLQEI